MYASLTFLALSFVTSAAPKMEVQFRPIANLTYQLDVVADQLPHEASANIKKLWVDQFLKTDEDRAMVKLWRDKRSELRNRSEPPPVSNVFFPIEWIGPHVDRESRVRGAGFDALDLADYGVRVSKESKEVGGNLEKVAAHFLPKFQDWWKSDAALSGEAYAGQLKKLLELPKTQKALGDFMAFYKADLGPNPTFPLVLLYRPSEIQEPSSGQQLGHYSVVQFLAGEKPESRIEVVLHEFAHFLYTSASPENLAKLQERFLALNSPTAIPAFNLMNEGLATALGNGIVAEQFSDPVRFAESLKKPRSFYNDPAIDATGKAVFAWIPGYLAKGGTLYDAGFAKTYVSSLEKAMPDQLGKPRSYLNRLLAFTDTAIPALSGNSIAQQLRSSSFGRYSIPFKAAGESEPLKENANTSLLIVVTPGNVGSLSRLGFIGEGDQKVIDRERPQIYAFRRNPNAIAYVIVATTADEAIAGIQKIAGLAKFEAGRVP